MTKVSIVIATRNRPAAIIACLDSIVAAIGYSTVSTEVIVVDNGSSDRTLDILMEWRESSDFPVRILSETRRGKSRALNHALQHINGEILAFTDDDCCVDKNYINDLVRYHEADTELVLRGGRIELGDPSDLPFTINTTPEPNHWSRNKRSVRYDPVSGKINGCNMTMHKDVIKIIGPFDEKLGPGTVNLAGEDTDYIYRAYCAGIKIDYVTDMTVSHFHGRKTVAIGYQLWRGYMIGNGALCVKYLFKEFDLCRPFYWDIKKAIREIFTGMNTFQPSVSFSHKHKVWYSVLGAVRYMASHMLMS